MTPRLWGEGIEPAKQFEKDWAEEQEDSQAVTSLQARVGRAEEQSAQEKGGPRTEREVCHVSVTLEWGRTKACLGHLQE